MTSYTLSPVWGAGAQLFDNSGNVLTGGKIYTYEAGTTTPAATYTTPTGDTFNSNPIIANASGRLANEIWLPVSGAYKFVLKDTNDVLIATYDNIPTIPQPPIVNDASSISYEQGYTVTAGAFTVGANYLITSVGTTNFVAIGASANAVGILFTATGVGSGTGTAQYSRTVQSKLQEFVSVKDFGAVGNGTTDDTLAIQNALNSVLPSSNPFVITTSSRGGCIYIPPGRYLISSPLSILPGTRLVGESSESSVIVNSVSTGNALQATTAISGSINKISIEDLAVVQISSVSHVTSGAGIYINNGTGTNLYIKNVEIRGLYNGLYMDWCYPATVINVISSFAKNAGFTTGNDCTSTTLQNCYSTNSGYGYYITGSYISLVNCASDSNNETYGTTGQGYGYYVPFQNSATAKSISFYSCGTEGCRVGISLNQAVDTIIVSPIIYVGSATQAPGSAIELLGAIQTTILNPSCVSLITPNTNPMIHIATVGGYVPNGTFITGLTSASGNSTFGSVIDNLNYVVAFGGTKYAQFQDDIVIGDPSYHNSNLQKIDYLSNFPSGISGNAYGSYTQFAATSSYTSVASNIYRPRISATGGTVTTLTSGSLTSPPYITAGTVTNVIGEQIQDMAGATNNTNLAIGNSVASGDWSIYNSSTKPNLFNSSLQFGVNGATISSGSSSPEGAITAYPGSIYMCTSGGAGTSLYVKESGSGNTGWVGK